jgi:hypothetical protein
LVALESRYAGLLAHHKLKAPNEDSRQGQQIHPELGRQVKAPERVQVLQTVDHELDRTTYGGEPKQPPRNNGKTAKGVLLTSRHLLTQYGS